MDERQLEKTGRFDAIVADMTTAVAALVAESLRRSYPIKAAAE